MTVVIISTIIFILTTQPELDEFHELDLVLDNGTKPSEAEPYEKNETVENFGNWRFWPWILGNSDPENIGPFNYGFLFCG